MVGVIVFLINLKCFYVAKSYKTTPTLRKVFHSMYVHILLAMYVCIAKYDNYDCSFIEQFLKK